MMCEGSGVLDELYPKPDQTNLLVQPNQQPKTTEDERKEHSHSHNTNQQVNKPMERHHIKFPKYIVDKCETCETFNVPYVYKKWQ